MEFDRERYLVEMQKLVAAGCVRLTVRAPRTKVWTVSIWTDPDARGSAISFDTRAHSRGSVARAERFRKREYARLLREGDRDMARLFAEPTPLRETNPADFAFRSLHEVDHRSMPARWAERSNGRCWTALGAALREGAGMSRVERRGGRGTSPASFAWPVAVRIPSRTGSSGPL